MSASRSGPVVVFVFPRCGCNEDDLDNLAKQKVIPECKGVRRTQVASVTQIIEHLERRAGVGNAFFVVRAEGPEIRPELDVLFAHGEWLTVSGRNYLVERPPTGHPVVNMIYTY